MSDTRNLVIGFGGRRGSGKSFAASAVSHTGNIITTSFAKPIKDFLADIFDVPFECLYGHKKEVPCDQLGGLTPRQVMRAIGDWHRNRYGSDYYSLLWEQRTKATMNRYNCGVVVDDVRYQHEVDAVHRLGGIVLLIERPTPKVVSTRAPAGDQHSSEALEFKPDHIVINNGGQGFETYLNTFLQHFNSYKQQAAAREAGWP